MGRPSARLALRVRRLIVAFIARKFIRRWTHRTRYILPRSAIVRSNVSTIIIGRRALLREGVASLLQDSIYRILAGASDATELKNVRVAAGRSVLVILGVDGTNGNLEEAAANIRSLRSMFPSCKIVLIAETSGAIDLQSILDLAPNGLIVNLASREILLKSLELTLLDQQIFVLGHPSTPTLPVAPPKANRPGGAPRVEHRNKTPSSPPSVDGDPALTARERQILRLLAQGSSNKVIARRSALTESTVKAHLKTILRKLDVQNRTQAAIWAFAHGFQDGLPEHPIVEPVPSSPALQDTLDPALVSVLLDPSNA
jgi:two-component system, NarL family, nitrate/nitrite response regulator NarL